MACPVAQIPLEISADTLCPVLPHADVKRITCMEGVEAVIQETVPLGCSHLEKSVRVWIQHLPHQIATVDIIKAQDDISLKTLFTIDNQDHQLQLHRYSDQRLVFRHNGRALKLFEMLTSTNGTVQNARIAFEQEDPTADSCVFFWEDEPGKEHIRIHSYVMDSSEEIVHWHVYLLENGAVRLENPEKDRWLDIQADMSDLRISNEAGDTCLIPLSSTEANP